MGAQISGIRPLQFEFLTPRPPLSHIWADNPPTESD